MSAKPGLAKAGTRGINRAEIVDNNFLAFLDNWPDAAAPSVDLNRPLTAGSDLTGAKLLELFDYQMMSRQVDLVAREMRGRNEGFYTIGSSGHEGNVAPGALSRQTDPAFLHYRSGGFMMARMKSRLDNDVLDSIALSLAASREDPVAGGRHKVWGSAEHWVLPQTSTIASQLPKAVGTAVALEQAKRLGRETPVPADSIVIVSFGDASANHATALSGFNAAQWTATQNLPVPIVFICEDNGLGISVRTPGGWIANNFSNRAGLKYFAADGLDLVDAYRVTKNAIDFCRKERKPVFLHLKVERLLGHAGTDIESDYRPIDEIESCEARDPLLLTAETALEAGLTSAASIRDRYEAIRARMREAAEKASRKPRLEKLADVMQPLAPFDEAKVNAEATRDDYAAERIRVFGNDAALPEKAPPRHLALQINRALADLMAKYPEATIFGEDVAQKGGVYTVTSGLYDKFKGNRVFNTLLDETTILGIAQGAGYMDLLPIPEIQYLAYLHNACDQLRGEAASMQYFSDDAFRNPMVIRIASLGYQKGFGGHFHNDNSFTALRDIPGLVIACPSRGDDAAMMLRTACAMAKTCGRVVAFLEPIALYMAKDLYEPKDGKWSFAFPEPGRAIPLGEMRVYNPESSDFLFVSYGNGVPMALRAARKLKAEQGIDARIIDLRWIKPLNGESIARHAAETGRVLVVDEGRRTGSLSEEIFTVIDEHAGSGIEKRRVVGADTFVPLGPAANLVMPGDDDVYAAASELAAKR